MEKMISKYNLFTRSTIVALLITVVIAVIAAWQIQQRVNDHIIEQAGASAADQVANVLNPSLTANDLKGSMSEIRHGEIDVIVKRNVLAGPVVRVQIWSPDGLILYSDDYDLVGQSFPVEEGIDTAVEGQIVSEAASLEEDEPAGEQHSDDLLRVYAPLSLSGAEANAAVYEIFYDLENVKGDITATHLFIWSGVLLASLLVFAVSFAFGRIGTAGLVDGGTAAVQVKTKEPEPSYVFAALYDTSRDLARAGSQQDKRLDVIVKAAVEKIHVTFACVMQVEDDHIINRGAHPRRVLSNNFGIDEKAPLSDLTTLAAVIESKEPRVMEQLEMRDLTEQERRVLLADFVSIVYLAPVDVEGKVAAVLILGEARDGEREPFTAEKIELARGLADLTADALQKVNAS